MKYILLSLLLFTLAACGQSVSGTYTDPMGVSELKFESGGKVYMKAMGMETEMKYEVDGKRVKLLAPQGNLILNIQDDGSLQGMGGKFTKK